MASPYTTQAASNTFILETQGYVEGLPFDDTVARLWLATGVLDSSETIPIWGGVPVAEQINSAGANSDFLGPTLIRATTSVAPTGFCSTAQMMHMVTDVDNSVPISNPGDNIGFFRFNSNQRLAVQLDPALVTTVNGSTTYINGLTMYWDVSNYRVTLTSTSNVALPSTVRLLSINTNSKIVSWDGTNLVANWTSGNAGILLL